MKKCMLVSGFLTLLHLTSPSQTFLRPMQDLNFRQASATTMEGNTFSGDMSNATMVMGYLNAVRIRNSSGEIMKVTKDNTLRIDVIHTQKLNREDKFDNSELDTM